MRFSGWFHEQWQLNYVAITNRAQSHPPSSLQQSTIFKFKIWRTLAITLAHFSQLTCTKTHRLVPLHIWNRGSNNPGIVSTMYYLQSILLWFGRTLLVTSQQCHIPDIGTPASFELVWYHAIIEMTNSNLRTDSNANKFPNVLTLNFILARVLQEEETKVWHEKKSMLHLAIESNVDSTVLAMLKVQLIKWILWFFRPR